MSRDPVWDVDPVSRRLPFNRKARVHEEALREIAALVDVSTISTNAHDWAFTLTQIREITDKALNEVKKT